MTSLLSALVEATLVACMLRHRLPLRLVQNSLPLRPNLLIRNLWAVLLYRGNQLQLLISLCHLKSSLHYVIAEAIPYQIRELFIVADLQNVRLAHLGARFFEAFFYNIRGTLLDTELADFSLQILKDGFTNFRWPAIECRCNCVISI